ncbi:hypothetical protein RhiXN_04763 [Rhizoctonia solani]|uniref:Uncharacterized protein n=1 Tax=Rhizoctonia solani TaxID=456999 RepID=A0A8H8NQS9_9AGAM|nr:uncharacterized protein RhiXN_04763 [Rhizoctonia solani]QRW16761.1 hypothetical protein RhiXN_04763 [Rhizoctonia solani]
MAVSSFKASSVDDKPRWFKVYVLGINTLGLVQTTLAIVQGFTTFGSPPPRIAPVNVSMLLTPIIAASVQPYFIHRCWIMLNKRLMPVIILVVLALLALTFGIIGIVTYSGWIKSIPVERWGIPMVICLLTILLLDAIVVVTTVRFLKQSREAPPAALLVAAAINEAVPGKRSALTAIFTTTSAKTYELSLMISLVGQGYIRRQIERCHLPASRGTGVAGQDNGNRPVATFTTMSPEGVHKPRSTSFSDHSNGWNGEAISSNQGVENVRVNDGVLIELHYRSTS